MTTTTSDKRDFDTDEPVTVDDRIEAVIEDMGGLPEDNPFTQIVTELREEGNSWEEIRSAIKPVFDIASKASFEASFEAQREWEVVTVAHEYDATTRTQFTAHTIEAETAGEAEEQLRTQLPEDTPHRIDTSRTKYQGVKKTKRDN